LILFFDKKKVKETYHENCFPSSFDMTFDLRPKHKFSKKRTFVMFRKQISFPLCLGTRHDLQGKEIKRPEDRTFSVGLLLALVLT